LPELLLTSGSGWGGGHDGALRRHPHMLQSPDVGDHCGPGVRPPIMAGGSGAPLILTSGSEVGGGQRLFRLSVSLRGGLMAFQYHHFPQLLACLPVTLRSENASRQFTHLHARLPGCLRGGLLACAPSTHACSHASWGAWQHVYFFVF
jgi:hypothetical protein